jgi:hypothetical protein
LNLIKENVINKIDSRFRSVNIVSERVEYVPAISLITSERLDLAIKLRFIDSFLKGKDDFRSKFLYKESMRIISNNKFIEPGDANKTSFEDYLNTFLDLANNIKQNGFELSISCIPLSENGIPLDGAHRIAICAALGLDIAVVYTDEPDFKYDVKFFESRMVADDLLNEFFLTYVNMTEEELSVVIEWPLGNELSNKIKTLYSKNVIYSKSLHLNYNGVKNLMLMNYWGEKWLRGDRLNNAGIHGKAKVCFKSGKTNFFWVKNVNIEQRINIKSQIRNSIGNSKHSIHSSDCHTEAVNISRSLLHTPSFLALNQLSPEICSSSLTRVLDVKDRIRFDNVLVSGSSVISMYGLRQASDVDTISDAFELDDIIGSHNKYVATYLNDKLSFIYEPDSYFYYFGIKFLNISRLEILKNNRAEKKDMLDVELINTLNHPSLMSPSLKLKLLYMSFLQKLIFLAINFLKRIGIKNFVKRLLKQ